MGHRSILKFAHDVHNDLSNAASNNWDDLARTATAHPYWTHASSTQSLATKQRRSVLAVLMNSAPETIQSWQNGQMWLELRHRLTALFKCLESAGCFVLKKGTIEDYYQYVATPSRVAKVADAYQEADGILRAASQQTEQDYSDVLIALKYASIPPKIDEAGGLMDLVLAVAGPALNRITMTTPDPKLNSLAQQILRERAVLFEVSNVSSQFGVPTLRIQINSGILAVSGFPLDLRKGADPVYEVSTRILNKALDITRPSSLDR